MDRTIRKNLKPTKNLLVQLQAFLALVGMVFTTFISLPLYAQPVPVIQLQLSDYSPSLMDEVYGRSYFLQSSAHWEEQVGSYRGLYKAYWEDSADQAIFDYVSTVNQSDAFHSTEAYQDYIRTELEAQKTFALQKWEEKANLHFLESKSEFLQRLSTNKVNEAYLSNLGIKVESSSNDIDSFSNHIKNANEQWEYRFDQNFQSGLNDFAASLQQINEKYQSFTNSLDESEAVFQANLNAIDQYKNVIKDTIRGIVGNFQSALDQPCSGVEQCLYRSASTGILNTAGETLQAFVNSLNQELNNSQLDVTNIFTAISQQITSFLDQQSNLANQRYADYSSRINTSQTTLPPTLYGSGNIDNYVSEMVNGNYTIHHLSSLQRSQWTLDNPSEGLFSGVSNPEIRAIVRAIHSGNDQELKNILESNLGGKEITIRGTNIYTKGWGANGDGFAWIDVQNEESNFRANPAGFTHWGANRGTLLPIPLAWTNWFQMGEIGYSVAYNMYDSVAEENSLYWNGNFSSLNGQLTQFRDEILPAISNWESHVASYNSFYEQYKVAAEDLKAKALEDYTKSISEVTNNRSAWIARMENERKLGEQKWLEIEKLHMEATKSQNPSEYEKIISEKVSQLERSANFDASQLAFSTANQYETKLAELSKQEFQFNEPQNVTQNITNQPNSLPFIEPKVVRAALGITETSLPGSVSNQTGFAYDRSAGYTWIKKEISASNVGQLISSTTSDLRSSVQEQISGLETSLLIPSASNSSSAKNLASILPTPSGGNWFNLSSPLSGEPNTVKSFSILTAAKDKKIETEIKINGQDLKEKLTNVTVGVGQYMHVQAKNEENEKAIKREQLAAIHKIAYSVNYDDRVFAKIDPADGSLKTSGEYPSGIKDSYLHDLLTRISNYSYAEKAPGEVCIRGSASYNQCIANEKSYQERQSAHYKNEFNQDIAKLASLGLEIQSGKIVRSLTDLEKQKIESCYYEPTKCSDLLKKDYDYSVDHSLGLVTLTKTINNGQLIGKDRDGNFISGKTEETRYFMLSQISPVNIHKDKNFFEVWEDEDWHSVESLASSALEKFFGNKEKGIEGKFENDQLALAQMQKSISHVEEKNEKIFQEKKKSAEELEANLKELLLAYITGGMASVNATIKNKIEDLINTNIATALVKATGGTDESIQMMSDVVSLVRGRMQADKIKRRSNANTLGKIGSTLSNMAGPLGMLVNPIGALATMSTVSSQLKILESPLVTFGAGKSIKEGMDRSLDVKATYQELKSKERSMIRNYASNAIATATGLPKDLVSQITVDYDGAQKAKKVRKAINANPVAAIGGQVVGIVGGMVKSAAVAFGAKDRDIQKLISDSNKLAFSGSLETTYTEIQSEAFLNKALGMAAPGTTYTSNVPTLKNKQAFAEEIGQRAMIAEIAKGTGFDKDFVDAIFRKEFQARKQREADKKAQKKAQAETAVNAAMAVVTLGASGVLSGLAGVMQSIGTALGAAASTATQVGAAVMRTGIQVAAGSANGTKGMLAGLANGLIGTIGAGAFDGSFISDASKFMDKAGMGVGISYTPEGGWGAALGIGNTSGNMGFTLTEHQGTQIKFSAGNASLSYNAANGSVNVGYNTQVMEGVKLGAGWDSKAGISANVSYTEKESGAVLSANIGKVGLSTSASIQVESQNQDDTKTSKNRLTNGVIQLGTTTENGYQAPTYDFVSDNLNDARVRNEKASVSAKAEGKKSTNDSDLDIIGNLLSSFGVDVDNFIKDFGHGIKDIYQNGMDNFFEKTANLMSGNGFSTDKQIWNEKQLAQMEAYRSSGDTAAAINSVYSMDISEADKKEIINNMLGNAPLNVNSILYMLSHSAAQDGRYGERSTASANRARAAWLKMERELNELKAASGGELTMADVIAVANANGIDVNYLLSPAAIIGAQKLAGYDRQLIQDRIVTNRAGLDVYQVRDRAMREGKTIEQMTNIIQKEVEIEKINDMKRILALPPFDPERVAFERNHGIVNQTNHPTSLTSQRAEIRGDQRPEHGTLGSLVRNGLEFLSRDHVGNLLRDGSFSNELWDEMRVSGSITDGPPSLLSVYEYNRQFAELLLDSMDNGLGTALMNRVGNGSDLSQSVGEIALTAMLMRAPGGRPGSVGVSRCLSNVACEAMVDGAIGASSTFASNFFSNGFSNLATSIQNISEGRYWVNEEQKPLITKNLLEDMSKSYVQSALGSLLSKKFVAENSSTFSSITKGVLIETGIATVEEGIKVTSNSLENGEFTFNQENFLNILKSSGLAIIKNSRDQLFRGQDPLATKAHETFQDTILEFGADSLQNFLTEKSDRDHNQTETRPTEKSNNNRNQLNLEVPLGPLAPLGPNPQPASDKSSPVYLSGLPNVSSPANNVKINEISHSENDLETKIQKETSFFDFDFSSPLAADTKEYSSFWGGADDSKIGSMLRNIPLIGGMLGSAGDVVSGGLQTATGLITLGQYGSITQGLKQIGNGFYNFGDIMVRDLVAGAAGLVGTALTTTKSVANFLTLGIIDPLRPAEGIVHYGTKEDPKGEATLELRRENLNLEERISEATINLFADIAIPEYGWLGGKSWGIDQFGIGELAEGLRVNNSDAASFPHDKTMNEANWVRQTLSTNPEIQWVGPIGAAYGALGTAGFGLLALIQGEFDKQGKIQLDDLKNDIKSSGSQNSTEMKTRSFSESSDEIKNQYYKDNISKHGDTEITEKEAIPE
ncbi:hypothetical protein LPTSP4_35940 [Leptospira ryugenii]|uniref:TIGR04388 family protein n=1 Tax=Leptospira ryugenii TaxID=1917863 RepID=A0A2P2E5A2_9LEPT|nr:TIGR04388 family protein [Leptospira ryugenii]GBF52056.1 hypothetical protein LPTSP4_35940 [Leptospira ryugenii]